MKVYVVLGIPSIESLSWGSSTPYPYIYGIFSDEKEACTTYDLVYSMLDEKGVWLDLYISEYILDEVTTADYEKTCNDIEDNNPDLYLD